MASSSSSSSASRELIPLVYFENCSGIHLEITRMVLVGGFPTIMLGNCSIKSTAKIFNNIFVKETLVGVSNPPEPEFNWDLWVPFDG